MTHFEGGNAPGPQAPLPGVPVVHGLPASGTLVQCPSCSALVDVGTMAGAFASLTKCPTCGNTFTLPQGAGPTPAPPGYSPYRAGPGQPPPVPALTATSYQQPAAPGPLAGQSAAALNAAAAAGPPVTPTGLSPELQALQAQTPRTPIPVPPPLPKPAKPPKPPKPLSQRLQEAEARARVNLAVRRHLIGAGLRRPAKPPPVPKRPRPGLGTPERVGEDVKRLIEQRRHREAVDREMVERGLKAPAGAGKPEAGPEPNWKKALVETAGAALAMGAAMRLATGAIGGLANAVNVSQNASLSRGQREQKVGEELPVIGGVVAAVNKLQEAMTGFPETLRRAGIALSSLPVVTAATGGYRGAAQAFGLERFGEEARFRAERRFARTEADRVTLPGGAGPAGERERRYALERLPLEEQARRAKVGVAAARAEAAQATAARSRVEGRSYATRTDVEGRPLDFVAGKDLEKYRSGKLRLAETFRGLQERGGLDAGQMATYKAAEVKARTEAQGANTAIQQRSLELEKAINAEAAKKRGLVQAEGDARRANLAILQQQGNIERERFERLRGQAQGYGALNVPERFAYAQAAEEFARSKKQTGSGLANLRPEVIDILRRGGGGEAVRREEELIGRTDPNARRAARNLGLDEGVKGDTLGEAVDASRKGLEDVLTKIRAQQSAVGVEMARGIADVWGEAQGGLADKMVEGLRALMTAKLNELIQKLRMKGLAV